MIIPDRKWKSKYLISLCRYLFDMRFSGPLNNIVVMSSHQPRTIKSKYNVKETERGICVCIFVLVLAVSSLMLLLNNY